MNVTEQRLQVNGQQPQCPQPLGVHPDDNQLIISICQSETLKTKNRKWSMDYCSVIWDLDIKMSGKNLHCTNTETHPRLSQCSSYKWGSPQNLSDQLQQRPTLPESIIGENWLNLDNVVSFISPPLVNSGSSQMNWLLLSNSHNQVFWASIQ